MPLLTPPNPPLADWRGRRAWLVGASSGIGEATALALHAAGAQVVVSARSAVALQALAARAPGLQPLPLDVTDAPAVRQAAAQLLAAGPLDLVCCCAGHYASLRATEFDLAQMERHLDVNYRGVLHVLDAVLPALLAQGHGHLSLVGSVAGYCGLPRALAYGPTKAALIQLAEILHLDLRPRGLGVSLINPGFVRTPLTAGNDFHMPALMEPADAARTMLRGWARGDFEIHFPRRFSHALKLLALLPFGLRRRLILRATGL